MSKKVIENLLHTTYAIEKLSSIKKVPSDSNPNRAAGKQVIKLANHSIVGDAWCPAVRRLFHQSV